MQMHLFAQDKTNFVIRNLDTINTKFSDFGTAFYDANSIIFSSARKDMNVSRKKWKGNDEPFLELYKGTILPNGSVYNQEYFSKAINSKYHESNAVFTKDKSKVYFSRSNYNNKKLKANKEGVNLIQLYMADVSSNGDWQNIRPMPFNSDEYQTGHPTLNSTDDTLIFVSDMPGGLGGTDIWMVRINEDDSFGTPINMGAPINSISKEMFPFVASDSKFVFASDRVGGFGGLDIYEAVATSDFNYEEVNRLPEPINSSADDFGYIAKEEGLSGYFSSNRPGGKGSDDIYYFTRRMPEIIVEEVKPCAPKTDGQVKEKFTGKIVSGALVELYNADTNELLNSVTVDDSGTFIFDLECNTKYKLVGVKKYYKTGYALFETQQGDMSVPLILEVESEFKEVGDKQIIRINPIYFDYDKDVIRPDAALELDKVVDIMRKYPSLKVEGQSHTDSRGRDSYNLSLSSRRAKSTVDYIIRKGISPSRIYARGYGETQLNNRCSNGVKCSDVEHQQNRRTDFVVFLNND